MSSFWKNVGSGRWLKLTRVTLGGGAFGRPLRFFANISQRRRGAPPFLAHLIMHLFRTLCENFRRMSSQVRSLNRVNPRPSSAFCHLRRSRGGGVGTTPPPCRFETRRGSASRKNQRVALDEISRLSTTFLTLGQYLTSLWQVKGQIFGKSTFFQLCASLAAPLLPISTCGLH